MDVNIFLHIWYGCSNRMFSTDKIWGTPGASLYEIPTNPLDDERSTHDTLQLMTAMARSDASSPQVQHLAHALIEGCKSVPEVLTSLWFWARDHILLKPHEHIVSELLSAPIFDKQLLIRPASLLVMPHPQGDCAIYSTLIASVCIALRLPSCFRIIAADAEEPERWSHVYVVAWTGEGSYALDASHGKYPGYEKPNPFRVMDWPV